MRYLACFAALAALAANAQQPQAGCDTPESHQFDFWVGDWDLSYVGGGTGRNHVTRILDGCAILEEFTGAPGVKLDGRSMSTFDRNARQWKQTWVDNTASYLDFSGGLADGRMILARDAERAGKKFKQRMVFEDIKADSLEWLWQRSDDGGATWKTAWAIHYRRIK